MVQQNARKRATARDVAKAAGVSVATVSRVLNGAVPVSGDTEAKVRAAIETLRFVPSSAARAINSGRSHLVGALVPTLDHSIFARTLNALESSLAEAGLSLIVAVTGGVPQIERARAENLLKLGVEGLIVTGLARDPSFAALVERYDVPLIATSLYASDAATPTIGYDNAAAARCALSHLTGLGHAEIGVISGGAATSDRMQARLAGLEPAGAARLYKVDSALEHGAAGQAARSLFAAHPQITAFLCLSDVLAQGALFALHRAGVAVPRDVSIIGVDDLPSSAATSPPLTSVHLPVATMGRAAGRAMAASIEGA